MNQNDKIIDYLFEPLFSMKGKMLKSEFNKIKKYYNWNFKFKKIHIVGTNGKGSNCKYLNDNLIENGFKVGLFTSPHLLTPQERIKINNKEIDIDKIVNFTSDFVSKFPKVNFGFFDLFFLTALRWFEEANVDIVIMEAGIGAKKDVTNYINYDLLLITSIALEHQNILGKSIESIARDKSYAIKKNTKVYVPNSIDKSIINLFKQQAKNNNSTLNLVKAKKRNFVEINESLSKEVLEKEFNITNPLFFLPPGRVQEISINNIKCFVDVAHNVEAINASLNYFKKNNKKFEIIVLSVANDKNIKEISKIIDQNHEVYVYQNKNDKALNLYKYPEKFAKIYSLKKYIKKLDSSTLFIGSFHLISEVLKEIN